MDLPKDVPVWVRLPNLSVHCWNYEALQRIGNGIGKFVDKADNKTNYNCTRICVEVDLEAGLPEAVKLTVGTWTHYQKVDYEHLPFKCRSCQEHRHFQRNCPKNQTPEKEEAEGWKKVKKSKAVPKNKDPRSSQAKEQSQSNSRPLKEPLKEVAATSKEQVTETIEIPSQSTPPAENPARDKSIHAAKETLRLEDEHTTTGSDPGADSDEGATETSSSVGTPKKAQTGRKPE